MSATNLTPDVVAARRQLNRDAARTCRLLREYAAKLHRIADQLHGVAGPAAGGFLSRIVVATPPQPDEVTRGLQAAALLRRRAVIAGMVEDTCRDASGKVDQAALPLAVKYELLLRLRETENALQEVREASRIVQTLLAKHVSASLLEDVPTTDLAAIERRRKAARDAVDAQQPQPVG